MQTPPDYKPVTDKIRKWLEQNKDYPVQVIWRQGFQDPRTYPAGHLQWTDTGHPWDIAAVKRG